LLAQDPMILDNINNFHYAASQQQITLGVSSNSNLRNTQIVQAEARLLQLIRELVLTNANTVLPQGNLEGPTVIPSSEYETEGWLDTTEISSSALGTTLWALPRQSNNNNNSDNHNDIDIDVSPLPDLDFTPAQQHQDMVHARRVIRQRAQQEFDVQAREAANLSLNMQHKRARMAVMENVVAAPLGCAPALNPRATRRQQHGPEGQPQPPPPSTSATTSSSSSTSSTPVVPRRRTRKQVEAAEQGTRPPAPPPTQSGEGMRGPLPPPPPPTTATTTTTTTTKRTGKGAKVTPQLTHLEEANEMRLRRDFELGLAKEKEHREESLLATMTADQQQARIREVEESKQMLSNLAESEFWAQRAVIEERKRRAALALQTRQEHQAQQQAQSQRPVAPPQTEVGGSSTPPIVFDALNSTDEERSSWMVLLNTLVSAKTDAEQSPVDNSQNPLNPQNSQN
jgi:hypothetical protein